MARALDPADQHALVAALADGQWHRGEVLAGRFGIGRAALSKRIEQLADWGLVVHSQAGVGYRLEAALELLDAERIRAAGGASLQELKLQCSGWIESTNSAVLAAEAADDPQAHLAEGQSAGRGRRGRRWVSPYAHNLYLSLGWCFAGWLPQLSALPLAVSVMLWRVLQRQGVAGLGIKWPNDLLVDGAKLGGILIENQGEAGAACRVVIGIGLNLAMPAGAERSIDQPWTSLQACLPQAPGRNQLAGELLAQLLDGLQDFERGGFEPFAADFRRADCLQGQPVRVEDNGRWQEGVAQGIGSQGALRFQPASGPERLLYSGDVSVRRQDGH